MGALRIMGNLEATDKMAAYFGTCSQGFLEVRVDKWDFRLCSSDQRPNLKTSTLDLVANFSLTRYGYEAANDFENEVKLLS